MESSAYTRQKLKILESVSPVDVSKQFMSILETFIFLDKAEQKEFAETLYQWAEQNATYKPLLFCYSKLILAFYFFYSEQYEKAFSMLAAIKEEFLEFHDSDGEAICNIIHGGIYRTFGNIDLALQSSMKGCAQLSVSGASPHFLMAAQINMGNIYYERRHYEEAIPLFKSTLEMAEPGMKYYWIVYALHGLGKIYLEQKKYDDAKNCLEKAMEASDRSGNQVSICNSLSELGNYYYSIENFVEAEKFHERALNLREQNNFTGGAITSCMRLAEIYVKDGMPVKALQLLEKGLQLAMKVNLKMKMYQVHQHLSQIYEQQNEPAKSLFHYKQFYELREQVEQEDNDRKTRNARLIFETEQTKKENTVIKKQKEEIERKNIELQETIDKLTRARVGKKAKAITLVIAIALFIMEDFILHFVLTVVNSSNYFISMVVKIITIFSLSPINKAIEAYLIRKVVKKKHEVLV